MTQPRLLLSWSSGKDSAWTLQVLRQTSEFEIVGLVTTVNAEFERVAMHGVRVALLEAQARAANLPLWRVPLPHPCSNAEYETRMHALIERAQTHGVTHMAFGDLFLADIRAYRERMLAGSGITPVFPLWGCDTARLARTMVRAGLRAVLTCIDPRRLDRGYAGRVYDDKLLAEFSPGVDPCGENGEFHTFCYAGPMYAASIAIRPGAIVERDGFVFADFVEDSCNPEVL